MKLLFIVAHPNVAKSLNHGLVQHAMEYMATHHADDVEVRFTDLYACQFEAHAGPLDFPELASPESFDYQAEQKIAAEHYFGTSAPGAVTQFTPELKGHIDDLLWCDAVILQFPFYWFTMPGVMKSWFDRCFPYHLAYGGGFSLAPRKLLYSVTTGNVRTGDPGYGHETYTEKDFKERYFWSITKSCRLTKLHMCEPYITWGVWTKAYRHRTLGEPPLDVEAAKAGLVAHIEKEILMADAGEAED